MTLVETNTQAQFMINILHVNFRQISISTKIAVLVKIPVGHSKNMLLKYRMSQTQRSVRR